MSYILDGTGASPDNLVSNELIQVNTVGKAEPQLHFLDNVLFYSKNFVAVYTDLNGGVRTLVYGTDYLFDFKISGIVDDNPIYAALRIENQTLNGTVALTYQALGGNWSLPLLSVREFLNSTNYNDRVSYVSLAPETPIISADAKTPIVLNTLGALEYSQAHSGTVILKPVLMELPEKSKVLADDDGVAFDGDGERLATSVDTSGGGTGGTGGNVDVSSLAKESGGNLAIIATKANQTALATGAVSDSAYGGTGATTIVGALKGVYNALVTSVNIRFLNSGTDSVKVEGGNTSPVLTAPSGTQAVSATSLPLPTGAAQESGGNLAAIAAAQGTPSDTTYTSGNGTMVSLLKAIFDRLGNLPTGGGGGSSRYLESSTDSVTAVIPAATVVKTDGSATIQPVSVSSLPLPSGAAQETGNLAAIAASAGNQADNAYAGAGSTSFIGGIKGLYERLTSLRTDVGDPAGAAWSGTGSGSLGAVLKAIYARLGGTLTTSTTVTSLPSLPAGSNAIGTVQVTNLPSTQAVSATSLPLPTGAATESGNLATIATQATSSATATGAQADAAYGGSGAGSIISLLKGLFSNTGTTNTNIGAQADAAWSGTGNGSLIAVAKAVYNKLAGTVAVSATTLPLPTGAATETGNLASIATSAATTAAKTTAIDTNIGSVKTNTQNTATSVGNLDAKAGATTDAAYNGSNTVSLISLLKGIYTSLVGTLNTRVLDFSTDSVTIHPSGTQTVATSQLPSSAGQHSKADSLSVVLATDQTDVKVTSAGGALALDASVQSVATAVGATPSYTTTLWVDKTVNPFVYYVRTETKPQSGNSTISWKLVDGSTASPTVANLSAVGSMSEVRNYTSEAAATGSGLGYSSGDKLANFVGINTNVTPQTVAYSFWYNVTTGTVLTASPTNGTYTMGSSNSVSVSSSALPSNAAQETGGNLATVAAKTTSIDTVQGAVSDTAWTGTGSGSVVAILKAVYGKLAGGVAVTGTFWQATQPVSAASLPLPTGAATESGNLSTIASTSGAQADAAYSGTGNGTIVSVLKGIYNKLAATLAVNVSSLPSLPAGSNAIGSVTVSNLPSIQAVSATALPLPTGAATETGNLATVATQTTAINSATGAQADAVWTGTGNGTVVSILKAVYGKLAGGVPVTGTFWQATQPVSAATLPLPTGAATETGNLASVATNSTTLASVTGSQADTAYVSGNGSVVSVLKGIFVRTGNTANYIGPQSDPAYTGSGSASLNSLLRGVYDKLAAALTVNVSSLPSLPAGANAIGSVSVSNFPNTQVVSAASLPLPTGAAQESGGNLAAIATSTSSVNTATGAQADAAWTGTGSGSVISVLKGLYAKLSSTLSVSVTALPSLPAGANAIGSVSVSNFPSTQAVSSNQLPSTLGQKSAAGSTSVILASDQGALNVSSTGGALALDSSIQTLINTIKSTIDIDGTVWYDRTATPTTYYIRRESVNEGTGAITISWENIDGTAATPTIANLASTKTNPDIEMVQQTCYATANGTGYSSGDILINIAGMDTTTSTTPALAFVVWLNVSTGLTLANPPTNGTYSLYSNGSSTVDVSSSALPANAAQETGGNLSAINTATGSQADASWSGSGNGSVIAILKSLNAKLSSALSVTVSGTPSVQVTGSALAANAAQETGGNLEALVSSNSALLTSTGVAADAAWSGAGNGNTISVLKAIYGKLASALTVAQGAAGAVANAWPVKISDGVNTADIKNYTNSKALAVALVDAAGNQITSMTGETSVDRQMPMDSLAKRYTRTVADTHTYTTSNYQSIFAIDDSYVNFNDPVLAGGASSNAGGLDIEITTVKSMAGVVFRSTQSFKEYVGIPSFTTMEIGFHDAMGDTGGVNRATHSGVIEFGRSNSRDGYFIRCDLNGMSLVIQSNGAEFVIPSTTWDVPTPVVNNFRVERWEFRVSVGANSVIKLYRNNTLVHSYTWVSVGPNATFGPLNLETPVHYRYYLNFTDTPGSINIGRNIFVPIGHCVAYEETPMMSNDQLSGDEPTMAVSISPKTPVVIDPAENVRIAGVSDNGVLRSLKVGDDGGIINSSDIEVFNASYSRAAEACVIDTKGYNTVVITTYGTFSAVLQTYHSGSRTGLWQGLAAYSTSTSSLSGSIGAAGSYTCLMPTRFLRVVIGSYTSGIVGIKIELTNRNLNSIVTNLTHIQGNAIGAHGVTAIGYGMPVQYRDLTGISRAPISDVVGNTAVAGLMKPGYKYNWNNADTAPYGSALYTHSLASSKPAPIIIGGLDSNSTTRMILTDDSGALKVSPSAGVGSSWGMGESLEEIMVLMRAMLFYNFHMVRALDPNFPITDEPASVIPEYRNLVNRATSDGYNEF